jgi:hypothetical protein
VVVARRVNSTVGRLLIMFPLPWQIVVFFLLIYLAIALSICVVYTLLLNLLLRTPVYRYLFSSALIGLATYIVTTAVLLYVLPPLHWVNTAPQDLRTTLWDHIHLISCMAAVGTITFWRTVIRTPKMYATVDAQQIVGRERRERVL